MAVEPNNQNCVTELSSTLIMLLGAYRVFHLKTLLVISQGSLLKCSEVGKGHGSKFPAKESYGSKFGCLPDTVIL